MSFPGCEILLLLLYVTRYFCSTTRLTMAINYCHVTFVVIVRLFCLVCCNLVLRLFSDLGLSSSVHVRCGLHLGRLTFLRHPASASLAGVSGSSIMSWPSQLRRRICIVLVLVYSSMLAIFFGQCMPRIFLRCLLWKVLTVFSSFFWSGSTVRCCREIHLQHMH